MDLSDVGIGQCIFVAFEPNNMEVIFVVLLYTVKHQFKSSFVT
jgi:hypothetical protein